MPCFLPQATFHYSSPYWSDYEEFNPAGGKTGFDERESKLPSLWNTSFAKICLGMKIDQQLRFTVLNKEGDSLYSLVADGEFRATSLGHETWKSLIGSRALCNSTATRKGLMQVVALPNIPNQESVLLETLRTNPTHATQGLDLVRKVDLMTQTLATLKT